MRTYSTAEVARAVGVHKATLLRWLYSGDVAEPKRQTVGGQEVRVWTERNLENVRRHKEATYCKGRGRPKQQRARAVR